MDTGHDDPMGRAEAAPLVARVRYTTDPWTWHTRHWLHHPQPPHINSLAEARCMAGHVEVWQGIVAIGQALTLVVEGSTRVDPRWLRRVRCGGWWDVLLLLPDAPLP